MKKKEFISKRLWHCMSILFLLISISAFSQADNSTREDVEKYFITSRNYKNQDKLDLALESLNKALILAEKLEDVKSIIDCNHEFSLLYLKLDKI